MADIRKDQERDALHRAIWAIADGLRGSVDGWDFKSYWYIVPIAARSCITGQRTMAKPRVLSSIVLCIGNGKINAERTSFVNLL